MSNPPTLCPRCGTFKPNVITLNHQHRGIVFQGCGDCLITLLDLLSSYQAPQCSTCGAAKSVLQFDNGAKRLECPVHAHGRGLLGRALQALAQFPEDADAQRVRVDIANALGIKQAT
jgi:ribosomal protein S27AE